MYPPQQQMQPGPLGEHQRPLFGLSWQGALYGSLGNA